MMAIGLDVHKVRTTVACLNLETQEMGRPYSVPTDQLARHLSELPGDKRMVLEAGSTSVFVARELESCGLDVIVVDAFKAHRLLEGRRGAKTDKLDAQGLAWLLGGRLLEHAQVWVCDEATHQLRELTRTREKLTRVNVIVRNLIRKFLGRQGANCPYRDLSGAAAQAWLDQLVAQLPEPLQAALSALCATLQALAAQLKQLEQALTRVAPQHPQVALVQSIPGFGPQLAAAVVAEIGDHRRFPSASHLRSYSGLVPRVYQSGEQQHTGPLVPHGNRHLRWALVLAAQNFARSRQTRELSLLSWYRQQVYSHGPNPAKVALARRLLNIIFAMLRDGTSFDPARYASTPAA